MLAIFAREPRPGAVKTRLCPPLEPEQAAALYSAMLHDVIDQAARRRDAALALWFDPPQARDFFTARVAPRFELRAQQGPDLGARMADAFRVHAAQGFDRMLLRGSDSPTLPRERVDAAFEALDRHDAVVCPDLDGGYNLIGLRAPADRLFAIEMSTETVLEQTRDRAARAGLDLHELPPHHDVDDGGDLERLRQQPDEVEAPRTYEWLRRHDQGRTPDHRNALVGR